MEREKMAVQDDCVTALAVCHLNWGVPSNQVWLVFEN